MSQGLPQTFKAIIVPEPGGIEKIELAELPFPEQKPNEVVVKVQYAGVNFIDTYRRAGIYPPPELPIRLGGEASGVIVKLPSDQSLQKDERYLKRNLQVGDRVVVRKLGSYSTYVFVPWSSVHHIPPSIPPLTAVAAFIQGLTALTFVTEAHPVQPGETILVHTIAGGLGLLFLQFAKLKGATVIGTTSTKEKAELAKSLGADHVIVYTEEDTVQRVLEITKGEGVHAVFDGVGKDTFDANFKLLRRKGTLVAVGNASGVVPPFAPLRLKEKNLKLLRPTVANYIFTPEEEEFYVTELFRLLESGVQVKVHKIYPFTAEGVQQTQRDITGRETVGKLIIGVDESV